jgi:hypothetical protein
MYFSFKETLSQLTYSGVGVGMTRDTSTLMVGQYFKRRRELVEILLGREGAVGYKEFDFFFENEEYRPFDGCKIEI